MQWLKGAEMAVVISQEQNEIETFRKWGLDIPATPGEDGEAGTGQGVQRPGEFFPDCVCMRHVTHRLRNKSLYFLCSDKPLKPKLSKN